MTSYTEEVSQLASCMEWAMRLTNAGIATVSTYAQIQAKYYARLKTDRCPVPGCTAEVVPMSDLNQHKIAPILCKSDHLTWAGGLVATPDHAVYRTEASSRNAVPFHFGPKLYRAFIGELADAKVAEMGCQMLMLNRQCDNITSICAQFGHTVPPIPDSPTAATAADESKHPLTNGVNHPATSSSSSAAAASATAPSPPVEPTGTRWEDIEFYSAEEIIAKRLNGSGDDGIERCLQIDADMDALGYIEPTGAAAITRTFVSNVKFNRCSRCNSAVMPRTVACGRRCPMHYLPYSCSHCHHVGWPSGMDATKREATLLLTDPHKYDDETEDNLSLLKYLGTGAYNRLQVLLCRAHLNENPHKVGELSEKLMIYLHEHEKAIQKLDRAVNSVRTPTASTVSVVTKARKKASNSKLIATAASTTKTRPKLALRGAPTPSFVVKPPPPAAVVAKSSDPVTPDPDSAPKPKTKRKIDKAKASIGVTSKRRKGSKKPKARRPAAAAAAADEDDVESDVETVEISDSD